MISLIPDESLARLKLRFGSKFQKFTKLEIQALVTADLEGGVDNARMRQITSEHTADITRLLQKLVGQGILTQDGQGRWTRYRLPREAGSLHKDFHSVHKSSDSVHKNHSAHKTEPSESEWAELNTIASPARENRRLPPKELESAISKLCHKRWVTRRQLAELLQRNADGLRSRFLTPMVEHGLLVLRYPEKPNRVDQAYTKANNPLEKEK